MVNVDITKKGEVVKTVKMPNTIMCAIGGAGLMAMYGVVAGALIGVACDVKDLVKTVVKKK